jgi:hypothetical protein
MRLIHFDRKKFRELIILVAEMAADDPYFGDTKFNKALFWSDFLGYRDLGRPVTGARYQKERRGPLARALMPVRKELIAEDAVRVDPRRIGVRTAHVTVPLRPADRTMFTPEELDLVRSVVGQLKGRTADEVSDDSHRKSAGWKMVGTGEDIPYSTALISTEPLREDTTERLRAAAARLGW